MRQIRSLLMLVALSLLAASSTIGPARADNYPTRPVKLIVPYPPGGPNDVIARILAQKLSEDGSQFFVENLPGAGGTIGTGAAAKARPDGYTLVVVNQDFVVQPIVKAKVPYDPFKSFAPVTLVVTAPESISVHPSLPVRNIQELIALLKANPGKYNYASPGHGTSPHLASERLFKLTYGVDVIHVPFQGGPPAVASTVAGHTVILPITLPLVAPHIKEGKLRGIAVADNTRSQLVPDLPTLEESGVPNHEVRFWVGLLAPSGTPGEIVERLNQRIAGILLRPDIKERLDSLGFKLIGTTPAGFEQHIERESAQWSKVVREAQIKID